MRGLDVRVQYALATIAVIAADPDAEQQLREAEMEAVGEGYRDFKNQIIDAPIMFSDVPLLLRAWNSGQDEAVHEQFAVYPDDDEYDF
jgi:hypothetical protein